MKNLAVEQSQEIKAKVNRVDLLERLITYSSQLIKFCAKLEQAGVTSILIRQLLRSGTAIGANVHEAQGGQSRSDFISKISIAYKEALETLYWLRILKEIDSHFYDDVMKWIDESSQLTKILSSIILTSKQKSTNGR